MHCGQLLLKRLNSSQHSQIAVVILIFLHILSSFIYLGLNYQLKIYPPDNPYLSPDKGLLSPFSYTFQKSQDLFSEVDSYSSSEIDAGKALF